MVFFTLINVSLDISTNIAWWITKNTLYGSYYLITYMIPRKKTKEELELIELRNEISQLNKKLHFINIIENNPNILTRRTLMLHENANIEELNDDLDLALLDDFVVFNHDPDTQEYQTSQL
jgi:hypothetical protein